MVLFYDYKFSKMDITGNEIFFLLETYIYKIGPLVKRQPDLPNVYHSNITSLTKKITRTLVIGWGPKALLSPPVGFEFVDQDQL